MNAKHLLRRLTEDNPADDPSVIGPISDYIAPVAFNDNIRDIVETARFFKEQAQEAGALSPGVLGRYKSRDIDRVMLRLAVEDMAETDPGHDTLYNRLKREMHSIWD